MNNLDRPDRREAAQAYADAQRRRGHTQVKIWLPEHMTAWLHQIAEEARKLHDVGLDPLVRLPASILPVRAEE